MLSRGADPNALDGAPRDFSQPIEAAEHVNPLDISDKFTHADNFYSGICYILS